MPTDIMVSPETKYQPSVTLRGGVKATIYPHFIRKSSCHIYDISVNISPALRGVVRGIRSYTEYNYFSEYFFSITLFKLLNTQA